MVISKIIVNGSVVVIVMVWSVFNLLVYRSIEFIIFILIV